MQVVMMKSALAAAADGSELKRTYAIGDSFFALHLKLTPASLEKIRAHPYVALVEENQAAHANQVCNQQNDVIWNLGRIDTHDIDLVDDNYKYSHAGQDVNVYIIDTGVLTTHVEFGGRAEWGTSFADDGVDDKDCNGHGTHVAGTVAGELYGVAKNATIIAVKVLGCTGSSTYEGVIAGIDWTVTDAKKRGRPSVANMSLGGGKSTIVNAAVATAVDAGVTFVVAAGNENTDACTVSPASERKAITVAASTIAATEAGSPKDRRASFSNFGKCVDIFAPGELIKSAWIDVPGLPPNMVYNTISGTSMASPHVAGVAALVLSQYPKFAPADVEAALYDVATDGVIDLACSSFSSVCPYTPNRLLYTNC
uniref:Serine proteinase n=1 Tax=Acanthamoeba castellanii TaxID=5755 RepID=A0A7R6QET8_ACACA|nr:serine proteinase [Acanthamoeba castellanii]